MLKNKKVEIEGFRGFTQKIPIELENPVTLLYGRNHQGKSSVLNAIEWCLYGDKCIGEKSGIRERVGTGEIAWRVVNDNSEKAQVKLEIEGEQGVFTITRAEVKGKGKKGKSIKISLPDGTEKKGGEADQEIAKLLRVSSKDFATTVYQHQETIHDFVIQKPSEQSDVMDRLLGLSDYRNILDGVKKSDVLKIQKELVEDFNKFQTRIQEAIKIRQKDLDDERDKAKEKGLNEEELNENKLLEMAELTIKDIGNFAQVLGLTTTAIFPPSDWKNIKAFIIDVKNECNRLWAESPDVKEQSEKQKNRSEIVLHKSQYETQYRVFKSKVKELQDFEEKNGKREEIDNKISKNFEQIEAIDEEIKRISPKAKLIEEGIAILESATLSDADICPLCGGKKVSNLLEHLREEWEEKIKDQVQELKKRQVELDKKKTDFERLKEEHVRLDEYTQREQQRLKKVINSISEFLHKELGDGDDPVSILSIEIKNIDSRLKEIEDAIKSKRSIIDAILEKPDIMNLLCDILLLKNKLEEINQIQRTDEYQTQEKIRTDVSNLVRDVQELSKIIKFCMLKEAEGKINSAKSAIDYYFRKITKNPAFQTLNIKVEEDKKIGGNFYIFEDQYGKRPIPILSQGDLNSLALSIFLGLSKTSGDSYPLGFILMDDSSQSLDSQQKARLVEILDEFSDIKNIIVSTMDTEMQEFLKNSITKIKTIYKFSDWAPNSGPNISKEI
ncbi:MAG TPA: AAA family ATPase [Candidatus Glassbacteria bacterium]|nr:AAA family ATPase [Candidatus Glassbacteria bacterium]